MKVAGSLTLEEVKERHKLYNKADSKEDKQIRRKHINWINKQIELDKKGVERNEESKAIWDWVRGEIEKGEKIKTPAHLVANKNTNNNKKYINISDEDEGVLREEIRQLKEENARLREEIERLREEQEEEEQEEPKKKEPKKQKPIVKGELEDITIKGVLYKKSVKPFRLTEKYYLWDVKEGHLVGIYNAISQKVNKVPKHLQGRRVVMEGERIASDSDSDSNSDSDSDSEKKSTTKKKANRWIKYVQDYAKKHKMNYSQALRDPKLKAGYKK